MDDLAQQRVRRATGPWIESVNASVQTMLEAGERAISSDAIDTLLTVELAKLGVPINTNIVDPSFLMGYVLGKLHRAGATREQILAFLANVIDESSKIEDEIVLPGMDLPTQLRMSRMLSAQIWEIFYAIEDASCSCTADDGPASDERWQAAIRAATFIAEFQMLVLRSV